MKADSVVGDAKNSKKSNKTQLQLHIELIFFDKLFRRAVRFAAKETRACLYLCGDGGRLCHSRDREDSAPGLNAVSIIRRHLPTRTVTLCLPLRLIVMRLLSIKAGACHSKVLPTRELLHFK